MQAMAGAREHLWANIVGRIKAAFALCRAD